MTPPVRRGRFFILAPIEGLGFINHGYPLSLAQVYTDLMDENHNNSVFLSKNAKKALFLDRQFSILTSAFYLLNPRLPAGKTTT